MGARPLTVRWVDKDDYDVAKSRLTVRSCEQELIGDGVLRGNPSSVNAADASGHPAMLRTLL
eukprot:12068853-Prorocentrum_lima.AAC.1